MTYGDAYIQLPADAGEPTSTFGNPGQGGYVEFYRCPDGSRWVIGNGRGDWGNAGEWYCEKLKQYASPAEIEGGYRRRDDVEQIIPRT